MKEYISVIKNYATFKGRARRREYWMFVLFNLIFGIIASILDIIIGDTFKNPMTGLGTNYGYIYLLYALFVFIPGLAVLVRRLHDIGKSGWFLLMQSIITIVTIVIGVGLMYINGVFLLILLIPFAISIWFLVLLCTDSSVGPNKYGPNPKGIGNIDEFDFMKTTDTES